MTDLKKLRTDARQMLNDILMTEFDRLEKRAPSLEFAQKAVEKTMAFMLAVLVGPDAKVEDHFVMDAETLPDTSNVTGGTISVGCQPKSEQGEYIIRLFAAMMGEA